MPFFIPSQTLHALSRSYVKLTAITFFAFIFTLKSHAQSPHNVVFTGSASDFGLAERFQATADNVDYYATFDGSNLYIGAFRTAGTFGSTDNLALYLDTDPKSILTTGTGTQSGQSYNGVTGTLPFTANYNVHAEEFYQEARSHSGSWSSTISGCTYYTTSTVREVAIPLSSIGNPYALYISMWMGYSNGIFANAPGASLGNGANPAVVNYFGGIGLRADDCAPLVSQNIPITDLVYNSNPSTGITVGTLLIDTGVNTVTNDFNVAAGGSIEVNGGTLNLANTNITFGAATPTNGCGTKISYSGGSIVSGASAEFVCNGETKLTGLANAFTNTWEVYNKLTFLSGGGTTISSGGQIDLRNGGYINGNAPTYANGSTLAYNTGNAFEAGTEWSSGVNSGVGVPYHVVIGNSISNSELNFGASTNYRQCLGNLTIESAANATLRLSSASGGDLQIAGDLTNNNYFIHNNRKVVMNGSSAQNINGNFYSSGSTNSLWSLRIDNSSSSGVTLNTSVHITGNSGNVLELVNVGRLNLSSTGLLDLDGTGGDILVSGGARNIRLTGINSWLLFSGTRSIVSAGGGSLNLTTLSSGTYVFVEGTLDCGANLTTIGSNITLTLATGGSISTNAPIYASGSTLHYNLTGSVNAGLEWSATSGAGYPHHVMISSATVLNLGSGAPSVAKQMGGDLTIQNNASLTMNTTPMTASLTVLGDVNVGNNSSATLTLSSLSGGDLVIGGDLIVYSSASLVHNNRTITFNGSASQIYSNNGSIYNFTLNNANGASLASPMTIENVLTLSNGRLSLANFDLQLNNSNVNAISGTFSSTRMLITNGTGQLKRSIATAGFPLTYTWPIGESTGTTEYTPASITYTANSASSVVGFSVTDGIHPQMDNTPTQTDYLSRYWTISQTGAANYTYSSNFTFVSADVVGAATNIRMNKYNSSWSQDATSSASATILSSTASLTQTTGPLTNGDQVTGRVNNGQTYVWNQTGIANFNTATNWTPNRTTAKTDDILVFNNGASTTATTVPTQTIAQLLISGNTTVTFTSTGSNTLTVAGSNGTDLSIASGSVLNISATTSNSLVLAHANSATTSINGTLTINANTALTNGINFTNTVASVAGVINNFGVITSTATNLNFNSGGQYNHNYTTTSGAIPVATWNANSTCRIQGFTTNSVPSNLNQTFGHFTWNCASQTGNTQLNGALTSVNGNLTVSSAGTGSLYFCNNVNYTLNVGGNYVQSGNTTVRLTSGNGTFTGAMNVAGSYSLSGTSTNFALHSGNNNTTGTLSVGGNFSIASGCSVLQTVAGSSGNFITWNGTTAQTITISGSLPANQTDYRLNNASGATLTGTIPVLANSVFYRTAGAITGGTITYNATSGSLVYEGTSAMTTGVEFPSSNGPVNVTINSSNVISLSASRTLPASGVFTSISGIFSLGAFDLTLSNNGAGALVNASPSVSNMIAADGAGQLKLTLPNSARDLQFYVGDITGTPEYSGIRLNFSANNINNRVVGIRLVDATSPNMNTPYAPIDFTSRHWLVTLSSTTGTYAYTPSITYDLSGDVNGTENNLQVAVFASGASAWNHYSTTITSPSLIKSGAALTQTDFSLNNATFAGRTPVMYWTGDVSSDWNDAGNWNTGAIPTSIDNVDINSSATNPCVLNTTATVNHLTINQSGQLTMSASANLTVAGNFTFVNTASAIFDCNSTLNITNTTFNQNIPAIQFGNLNLGTGARTLANSGTISICGNYTPTTGTLTATGSTVVFNGTSAQAILTNATAFNNLTIANTSANVNSAANVSISGTLSVNTNARLNKSAGTLTLSSGSNGQINGYLRNAGTITTTGVLNVNNGGTYEHNFTTTAGTVPTAIWNTGSTCSFIGYTTNTNAPSNIGQAFYHVNWNCPGQTANLNLAAGMVDVNGDFVMQNSGSGQLRMSSTASVTIDIAGSFIQTGGYFNLKNGNNNQTNLLIGGNFNQSAGTFDGCNGNNGYSEVRLSGNFSRTGSGILTSSGTNAANTLFLFQGSNQTIFQNTTGQSSYCDFDIANGSTTTLLSNFVLNTTGLTSYPVILDVLSGGVLNCEGFEISGVTGVLTRVRVNSGATIRTAHALGLTATGLTGTVQTDNRTFNSGATYVFDGAVNQTTGNFWSITSTANTVANLTLDNTSSTVTLGGSANVVVSNALTFTAANTAAFDAGTYTIQVSNSATNAVVRSGLGHVIGNLSRAILPSATNTYTFHVGTATAYAPVVSILTMSAGAGAIIAKATDGPHPQMATDGLSQTAYCNRYWTLTNNGATVTSASHTFQYLPTDLIGGATDASLQLARYNSGWTYPSTVTGSNAITGASLNNTTSFGEFFAANCSTFLVSVNPISATICNGQSVTLNASTNFGIPSYAWTGAGLNVNTGNSVIASPTASITYTVVATTAQNCTSSAQVTIQVNPRPTGALSGSTDICVGSSATLSIAFTGAAPWSGTLSNGMTFNTSSNPYNFNVTPGASTSITISSLTDANCTSLSADMLGTATVTVHNLPNATISGPASACLQATATFVVTGTPNTVVTYAVNGGANQYVLLNGGGLGSINRVISAATTIQLIEIEGDYCTIPLTSTWTTNPITLTANISGNGSICAGSSSAIQFSGTANAVVIFTINGGSNQTVLLDGSGNASVNTGALYSNTVYQLVGVQSGSCFYTLSGAATISITELPDATFVGGGQVCGGSTQNIQVLGTANALVTYTINGGSAQNLLLNGSGSGSISTAPLLVNTSYELVSVSLGSCSANVGVFANFTIIGNTYYQDLDGDGFGNGSVSQISCTPPIGFVGVNGDCDDSNPALNPNTDWYADMDGDGYGSFIYATQCTNPGVAGVVSLGGDCDDNNPSINSSGSEVCGNGIDDNCNGQIDEGCIITSNDSIAFATNIQSYVNSYPLCNTLSGTTIGSTNSPESSTYTGRDKWYKFQATTSACRIHLTASGWNGALQLCDQNFAPVVAGAENAVNGAGNEILIKEGLTVGQWYYVSVGGASIADAGNFALCVQLFLSSGCNTSTALPLDLCSPFRARSTGAGSFTYTFTPLNSGMGGGSVTVPGLVTLSNPALNLIPGQQYSVNVACTYAGLVNGAGVARPNVIMTGDASACVVTMAAHQDLQVRASQRCDAPATLVRNTYLRTDPFVCNVANYTYEFTPTSSCSDYSGIGLPFTYNHVSRNIALNFNGTTTSPVGQTIQPQTYYIVRVRPNFGAGGVNAGSWGTPRIIFIGGTLMAESDETPAALEETTDVSMAIYPNPGGGESLNLELFGMKGDVTLLLMDQFGRLVETKKLNASEAMVYQWMFDTPLANGLYHIRAINQELTTDKKYLVTR